jgi:hypothetical protein
MSYVEHVPLVSLHLGDALEVMVQNPNADVTTPTAADDRVLCRASVTPAGRSRTATFVAVRPGTADVGATITGVPGGISHPAYGVRITVLPPRSPSALGPGRGVAEGAFIAVGGPAGAQSDPQRGRLGFRSSTGELYTVAVGPTGLFDVPLPAGIYTVTGRSPQYDGGRALCQALQRVRVQAGQTADADVLCQRS